jgi:hypothetical protein
MLAPGRHKRRRHQPLPLFRARCVLQAHDATVKGRRRAEERRRLCVLALGEHQNGQRAGKDLPDPYTESLIHWYAFRLGWPC